jgi:hypothetical protein
MNKSKEAKSTQEEMVAAALNEQGFLFSQVVRQKIRYNIPGGGTPQTAWRYVESEYPVTASDGSQTRIDLLLDHRTQKGVHLCLECKRANPLYKQWFFFDAEFGPGGSSPSTIFFETFKVTNRPIRERADAKHAIEQLPTRAPCLVFNAYLEVAINRHNRAGHTETIEDACLQVIKGHTGLMAKLLDFNSTSLYCSVPVIVTTAKLFKVRFDYAHVSLASGTIDASDLNLEELTFCAVNYRPEDRLALNSKFAYGTRDTIESDVTQLQTRTIFVAQSDAILPFLNWMHASFFSDGRL